MTSPSFAPHPGLATNSRLQALTSTADRPTAIEFAGLVFAGGVAAALTTFVDLSLRIPGPAILRAVLPMTIGLALVPRREAGTIMGVSALVAAIGFRVGGVSGSMAGLGAMTSLTATGPLLDLSLRKSTGGWKQYAAFAVAGLASNLLAFAVKAVSKGIGLQHAGGRPLMF